MEQLPQGVKAIATGGSGTPSGGIGGSAYQPVQQINANFDYWQNKLAFEKYFNDLAYTAINTSIMLASGFFIRPSNALIRSEVESSSALRWAIDGLFATVNNTLTSWRSDPGGFATNFAGAIKAYTDEVGALTYFLTQGQGMAHLGSMNLSFTDAKFQPSGLIFGYQTVPVVYNIRFNGGAEYYATSGPDLLFYGSPYQRIVQTGGGDDFIVFQGAASFAADAAGSDAYVFLDGEGTLIFSENRSARIMTDEGNGVVKLRSTATGEVDTVVGAARIQFADSIVEFGGRSGGDLRDDQVKEIVKLYIAYFNRAPEYDGLRYHIAKVEERLGQGASFDQALRERAETFYESAITMPTATGYYVGMPSADFVRVIYENVQLRPGFGGPAPTSSEVDYWVRRLENRSPDGPVSRGEMVLEFLDAIPFLRLYGTPEEKEIVEGVDAVLQNRIVVGLEFSKPQYSFGLTGEAATYAGKAALENVTGDPASVSAAIAALQKFVAEDSLAYEQGASPSVFAVQDVDVEVVGLSVGAEAFV